jgi:hypothetical protein
MVFLTLADGSARLPAEGLVVAGLDYDGKEVYVFYCLWQDGLRSGEQLRVRDHWDDRLVGLESVFFGERHLGQQTLEIVISGYSSSQDAESALRRQMEDLIRI